MLARSRLSRHRATAALYLTSDLVARGGKDYFAIAKESHRCYECQYGAKGSERSEKYTGKGVQECLIEFVELD